MPKLDSMETSPRVIRLRALFVRLIEVGNSDADLDAVCDEIHDIGKRVWASPVQDWTDILERALVAHYWFREEHESPDIVAARELIAAVLAYTPAA